jgi:hypothetical protein
MLLEMVSRQLCDPTMEDVLVLVANITSVVGWHTSGINNDAQNHESYTSCNLYDG